MNKLGSYLKRHTELLVKSVGVEACCDITGKAKATLGRYYSESDEHLDRFMPIDVVSQIEAAAPFPHVTAALADLRGLTMAYETGRGNAAPGGVNSDVIALSRRFAMLMGEYHDAIADGRISSAEAKRMLTEAVALQEVLMQMKLHLEAEEQ